MTDLEREVALAISPNINEPAPEEWLPEARRAIFAIALALREHDQASDGKHGVHSITAHWLKSQISKDL